MQSLVLLIIDYADSWFTDATEDQINKLERLQNVIRLLLVYVSMTYRVCIHLQSGLNGVQYVCVRTLIFLVYCLTKLFNPSVPEYLRDGFTFLHPPGSPCRLNVSTLIQFPSHNSIFLSNSFHIQAVKLWY